MNWHRFVAGRLDVRRVKFVTEFCRFASHLHGKGMSVPGPPSGLSLSPGGWVGALSNSKSEAADRRPEKESFRIPHEIPIAAKLTRGFRWSGNEHGFAITSREL